MKYIIFIALWGSVIMAPAQNFSEQELRDIDSLNIIINTSGSDTALASAYVALSERLYVSNLDTMIPLCEKAKSIAEAGLSKKRSVQEKKSLYKSLGTSFNNLGYVYKMRGDIANALLYQHKALEISKSLGEKKGIADVMHNLGYIYKEQGETLKALNFFYESLKIYENLGHRAELAVVLNNIGLIYYDQNDFSNSLEYWKKSLKIKEENGDKYGIATSLNNLASVYRKQGNLVETFELLQRSLSIREEIGDKQGVANVLHNLGYIYLDQNERTLAVEYFHKGLNAWKALNDKKGMSYALKSIGEFYLEEGDLFNAKKYTIQSLEIAKELGFPQNIQMGADLLFKIHKKEKNYKGALENYELSTQMRDSIRNKETLKATFKQQMQYEYEKKSQADSIKSAEAKKVTDAQITAQEAQLEQEQTQRFALYGGVGLLFLFGGFMYNRFRITNKQKNIIQYQKTEVELQKHLLEEKNKEITDSITYAKRLQEAILPPIKLVKEYLPESFILYQPKDIVAGDFYWMEVIQFDNLKMNQFENEKGRKPSNQLILLATADCTGHGVPGAMVSVVCSNALNRAVKEFGITEPGKILDKVRELVIETFEKSESEVKDGMDISLCALNTHTRELNWAGAYNPLWVIRNGTTEIEEVKADKQPIGISEQMNTFATHAINLNAGDSIYIFTDGFADQFGGEKGKKFKSANFKKLLVSIQDEPMEKQQGIISMTFERWKGNLEQVDDVCVIGVSW